MEVPGLRTAYALPVPKQRSVFSYQLVIHNKAEWTKWEDVLNTNASLPRDVYAGNMIIPTLDTVRWELPTTAVTGYEESRQLLVDFLIVSLKANLN